MASARLPARRPTWRPNNWRRGETTIQSDLYSLGLILYEAFTGQPVHKSGSIEELNRVHAASSPRPPAELVADLDPAVERAILHCLQTDPRQRPASARAVADALVARETPSPGSPPRESPPEGKPSLAVLPFVNMNADHENEFLSDGITEDLDHGPLAAERPARAGTHVVVRLQGEERGHPAHWAVAQRGDGAGRQRGASRATGCA